MDQLLIGSSTCKDNLLRSNITSMNWGIINLRMRISKFQLSPAIFHRKLSHKWYKKIWEFRKVSIKICNKNSLKLKKEIQILHYAVLHLNSYGLLLKISMGNSYTFKIISNLQSKEYAYLSKNLSINCTKYSFIISL